MTIITNWQSADWASMSVDESGQWLQMDGTSWPLRADESGGTSANESGFIASGYFSGPTIQPPPPPPPPVPPAAPPAPPTPIAPWSSGSLDFQAFQRISEQGLSASDIARESGRTEQSVADELTRLGVSAGFASPLTVGRDAIIQPFLQALTAEQDKGPPCETDAQRPWWTVTQCGVDENGNPIVPAYFDFGAFTAAYVQQNSPEAQNFARIMGGWTAEHGVVQFACGARLTYAYQDESGQLIGQSFRWDSDPRIAQYSSYPTSTPLEKAAMQMTVDTPVNQALLARFGDIAQCPLPDNELGDRARAFYGTELATTLQRLTKAYTALRNEFIGDMNVAMVCPPYTDANGNNVIAKGWVYRGMASGEDGQPFPCYNFDPSVFYQAYVAEHPLLGQLYGNSLQVNPAHGNTYTSQGQLDALSVDMQSVADESGTVVTAVDATASSQDEFLLPLDSGQSLWDTSQVVFRPAVGFVTPTANLHVEQDEDWFDQLVPFAVAAGVTWFSMGTLGPAAASSLGLTEIAASGLTVLSPAGLVASAAIGGAASSAITGAINGDFSWDTVFKTALTQALTQGLSSIGTEVAKSLDLVDVGPVLPGNAPLLTPAGQLVSDTVQRTSSGLIGALGQGRLDIESVLLNTLSSSLKTGLSLGANGLLGGPISDLDQPLRQIVQGAINGTAQMIIRNDSGLSTRDSLIKKVSSTLGEALADGLNNNTLDALNRGDITPDQAQAMRYFANMAGAAIRTTLSGDSGPGLRLAQEFIDQVIDQLPQPDVVTMVTHAVGQANAPAADPPSTAADAPSSLAEAMPPTSRDEAINQPDASAPLSLIELNEQDLQDLLQHPEVDLVPVQSISVGDINAESLSQLDNNTALWVDWPDAVPIVYDETDDEPVTHSADEIQSTAEPLINSPITGPSVVDVQRGDTLEAIAKRLYGDQWRAGLALLIRDNDIHLQSRTGSPLIRPGDKLIGNSLENLDGTTLQTLSQTGGAVVAINSHLLTLNASRSSASATVPSELPPDPGSFNAGLAATDAPPSAEKGSFNQTLTELAKLIGEPSAIQPVLIDPAQTEQSVRSTAILRIAASVGLGAGLYLIGAPTLGDKIRLGLMGSASYREGPRGVIEFLSGKVAPLSEMVLGISQLAGAAGNALNVIKALKSGSGLLMGVGGAVGPVVIDQAWATAMAMKTGEAQRTVLGKMIEQATPLSASNAEIAASLTPLAILAVRSGASRPLLVLGIGGSVAALAYLKRYTTPPIEAGLPPPGTALSTLGKRG